MSLNLTPIAIVGMACRYPEARSPLELWENVLAKRRAFRRIPTERLPLEDYFHSDRTIPDTIYSTQAALIEDYEFDRLKFKVVGSTFRSADLAHWLALDIAAQALKDAGFEDGKDLPKETTGVLLGNTLTGEFSRANTLRLRWPYVYRTVENQLIEQGIPPQERHTFLTELEAKFKKPLTPIGEESLAGNLSNTIAGRICNHFDLKGGGYVVDGACSSSLLAVANACSALLTGDLDVALAGGVDLSLDPFELVGFAKAGALTDGEMRVYDVRSNGFIPGEGCGFVVLMRYEDALAENRRIYGLIRGWGISSDGNGGITRPEVEGQLLALQRAYRKAGFSADTVAYFEGHGTGTPVGDATEIQALTRACNNTQKAPAVIGSIKANIGHTKAAAGIAGLIKATMALNSQILPPTTGCENPHPLLTDENSSLKTLSVAQLWPESKPLRAGVSAMGFGGINTHIVLEGLTSVRRQKLTPKENQLLTTPQDAELILISAKTTDELKDKIVQLLTIVPKLSRAEMGDLAAQLAKTIDQSLPVRAALIASNAQELTHHLETLQERITSDQWVNHTSEVFLSMGNKTPRIGFLFPGQAAPVYLNGGIWEQRFPQIQELYGATTGRLPLQEDIKSTAVAQPAIITASLAGLKILEYLGVNANIALGHSLGELAALHWGCALDENNLIDFAFFRGKIMAELGYPTGTMASIGADEQTVKELFNGRRVTIAGLNSPSQTVISGELLGVNNVIEKAKSKGLKAVQLPVSHAFHSPLVSSCTQPLAEYLAKINITPLQKKVISTVTGSVLEEEKDLRSLLVAQITSPVRFIEAVSLAAQEVDLLIEVGPGQILSRLSHDFIDIPVISLDASSQSLKGLLKAVGAAFALGAPINLNNLFEGRFTRPFNLNWQPNFLINPCSYYSRGDVEILHTTSLHINPVTSLQTTPETSLHTKPLDIVRQLVAQKTELPLEMIKDDQRLLGDLHLNSISVGQLVTETARSLGLSTIASPTDYAGATIAEIAQALENLAATSDDKPVEQIPTGVDTWVRIFTTELVASPLKVIPIIQDNSIDSDWQIITTDDYILLPSLQEKLEQYQGKGVVVCLPTNPDVSHLDLLLESVHPLPKNQFVLVQHGGGVASFARTFYLENPQVKTCVIDVPITHPQVVEWIMAEIASVTSYTEAYYDEQGERFELVLKLDDYRQNACVTHNRQDACVTSLTSEDVLLVTGGGKGIAAECALSIAKETGVRLALLGRSDPATDPELANNLNRLKNYNIKVIYYSVNVTDEQAVKTALTQIEYELGAVTAIIHGAGINQPKLLKNLDKNDFLSTLAPKIQGLQNLLTYIKQDQLKLLITFGSIIARTGLAGEAHYGLANEWLGRVVEQFKLKYPHCHCLNLDWSVWSGVGMGERLGRIDALMQQGITPITPDLGISILNRLITQSLPTTSVIISGRFGDTPTLKVERPELPFLRFIEQPKVYYPGVELIIDTELSTEIDPYLNDHVYQGERIFPGVMGLEAMAQVAMALLETSEIPIFEQVKFNRPVVVSDASPLKIRIAALKQESGIVKVVLRSEQNGFAVDHFEATFNPSLPNLQPPQITDHPYDTFMDGQTLYGDLLFHSGRFQRLQNYHHLRATECIAQIRIDRVTPWFSRYLPSALVLGDPGARDAVIHALQACVPHATLLPTGIEKLVIYGLSTTDTCLVSAKERKRLGDTFIYDLDVLTPDGIVLEHWQGLTLQIIQHRDISQTWIKPLLVPYLERQITDVIPTADVMIVIDDDGTVERKERSDRSILSLTDTTVTRRTDGKPDLTNGKYVSVSHTKALTLAVAGSAPLACDVEPVITRNPDLWCDLLGTPRLVVADTITSETKESLDIAATRVWCASECLKKVGAMVDAPLILDNYTDGAVWFKSGETAIASFVVSVQECEQPLVFAVLVKKDGIEEVKNYDLNMANVF